MSASAVIAAYTRSPFTPANRGELAATRPDEIAGQVVKGLIDQAGIDPNEIENLILGCAFPEGEQGMNLARMVALLAGLPNSVAGVTVNQFCGSAMQAIHMATGAISCGAGEAFICGGVESMTRIPVPGFNFLPHPGLMDRLPEAYSSMGITAENVATKFGIDRETQEVFALKSQEKAANAQAAGHLDGEITAIRLPRGEVNRDGCLRPDTTLDGLAALKPAFDESGVVTAGTSSPLTDGATATLVCSENFAATHGLTPIAHVRAMAVAGCAPEIMGIGPVAATRKVLARAGIGVSDLDVIEINEAFASQAVACLRELDLPEERVNLDGGAIALGHPLGATGARITAKAGQLLQRVGGRYALATQCVGGGQGIATVLEAPQ